MILEGCIEASMDSKWVTGPGPSYRNEKWIGFGFPQHFE
jgi:hypothetical protein